MDTTLDIQELAIVIAAKNHTPTILNPDFLKYSGIVPADWELAQAPVRTASAAQVTFQNGVNIVAQFGRVMFSESLAAKELEEVKVAEVARKYVSALPNVDYQAVGISPRSIVAFNDDEDGARKYIVETLLSPGSWHEFGEAPVQAAINFVYTLNRGQLSLAINEARLQLPEKQTIPAVLFSANLSYDVSGDSKEEQLGKLYQAIENWQADLETYREIVDTKFLKHRKQMKSEPLVQNVTYATQTL